MFTMTRAAYFEAEDYFVAYVKELGEWMPVADPQTIKNVPVTRYARKVDFEAMMFDNLGYRA